jgi:hypothetical protein
VVPIIEQYAPHDIFNMDETALFYHAQPKRTLDIKGERCHGRKAYKDGVTVLLCCNADGSEKLRSLVVGKFEKPCCMKGVKYYLCDYKASKNVWVTGKIFREWLLCLERKMACKNRNLLLLLDQCSAHNHKGLTLKHVRLLHLPANATSYMQPLDQGIIYTLKRAYWKCLVCFLLREIERNVPATGMRKWNVMDAMRGIAVAWESITSTVIQNCFF